MEYEKNTETRYGTHVTTQRWTEGHYTLSRETHKGDAHAHWSDWCENGAIRNTYTACGLP